MTRTTHRHRKPFEMLSTEAVSLDCSERASGRNEDERRSAMEHVCILSELGKGTWLRERRVLNLEKKNFQCKDGKSNSDINKEC